MPTQHGRAKGVAKLITRPTCGGNKKPGNARGFIAPQNKRCSVIGRLPNNKQGRDDCVFECACSAKCNMHFSS